MGKEEILNYFYTNSANLGIKTTIIIIAGYGGRSFDRAFPNSSQRQPGYCIYLLVDSGGA